ncbi:MAG: hypothetical protein U0V87_05225 [Acidobacteriota bacterium]
MNGRGVARGLASLVALAAGSGSLCLAQVTVSHLYNLANFSGVLPFSDVRLSGDSLHDELYVIEGNAVRVFNPSGMEIFTFGNDTDLGNIRDLVVDEDGDLFILSDSGQVNGSEPEAFVLRCNYRGEPKAQLALTHLPEEFAGFSPSRMFYRDGKLLLVSTRQMWAVSADRGGSVEKSYDLGKLAGVDDTHRPDTEIFGVDVDPSGNLLFTIPVMFRAFVMAPDGSVSSFGRSGSGPGMFGITAGITGDGHGNIFVADKLRSVVMVFDSEFRFVREFGARGIRPENLIVPNQLTYVKSGKLFVTQARSRGVSVFTVTYQ